MTESLRLEKNTIPTIHLPIITMSMQPHPTVSHSHLHISYTSRKIFFFSQKLWLRGAKQNKTTSLLFEYQLYDILVLFFRELRIHDFFTPNTDRSIRMYLKLHSIQQVAECGFIACLCVYTYI